MIDQYEHLVDKAKEKAGSSNNYGPNNAGAVAAIAYAILALAEAIKYHADVTAPPLPESNKGYDPDYFPDPMNRPLK